jgi:diguanylate cyclase (GGDEF)-like protein
MPALNPAARFYLGMMLAAATTLTLAAAIRAPEIGWSDAPIAVALAILLAASYCYPLSFARHAHLNLDSGVILATVLLLPLELAILVCVAGPAIALLKRRGDWIETLFNASQWILQAAAAGAVLNLVGWWDHADPFTGRAFLLAVPLASITLYLVNTLAVAMMIALQQDRPVLGIWRRVALDLDRTEVFGNLTQFGFGVLAAMVVEHHPWGLALLVLPGIVVYSALSHHVRLRLRAEERLVHQAFHDPLTDLPNRILFTERVAEALERAGDEEGTLAVLFLDLDRFKLVNDTLGHEAGDHLLIEVAARLQRCIGASDTVARLGGDEFTILLTDLSDKKEPERVSDRIAEAISAPIAISSQEVFVTTSIGILLREAAHQKPSDLLRDADLALYRAKENGRARAAVFQEAMGVSTRSRVSVEHDLRRALEGDEFRLLYQPLIDLATGELVGLEAILHWSHPERGLLGPESYLAVAEETGLVVALGRRALTEVCQQGGRWYVDFGGTPTLSLDLSPRLLFDLGIASEISWLLAEAGLPADRLRLEIAENMATAGSAERIAALARLREIGIGLALDRFGAGASHLGEIGRLPMAMVKLDQKLIANLDGDAQAETVLRMMVGLGQALGLTVTAEGIATPAQAELLALLGCTAGQGPLFSPPLSPDQVAVYLADSGPQLSGASREEAVA